MAIKTSTLACSADLSWVGWTVYTDMCLGGITGSGCGAPEYCSALPMLSVWAVMGTHSFLLSSFGLILSMSQSQAIALACASSSHMLAYIQFSQGEHSQFIGTHMRYRQTHPCHVGQVCSHQALSQLLNGAIYLLLEDACLGILHLAWFKFSLDHVYWVSVS